MHKTVEAQSRSGYVVRVKISHVLIVTLYEHLYSLSPVLLCYTDGKDFQCCVDDSHLFCVSVSCVSDLICKSFSDSGVKDL